jgi:nuclear cap-binding protein subunit 1
MRDMIDIFEVNRKECARILLEYPKWCHEGTFKPRPGAPAPETNGDVEKPPGKDWQLESVIIEVSEPCYFGSPPMNLIYYLEIVDSRLCVSPP